MDIFVGSIPFKLKETELKEIFEKYGVVNKVTIIIDKITRQNKGYGFVEMANDDEALKAIEALDGAEVDGRPIVVNKSGDDKKNKNNSTTSNTSTPPKKNFGEDKRKGGSGNFNKGGFKGGNRGGGPGKGGFTKENKKGGGGSKKY